MIEKRVFEGQAVHSELVVAILEKYELHPTLHEQTPAPNFDDLERDTCVTVPEHESEVAEHLLSCECTLNPYEF